MRNLKKSSNALILSCIKFNHHLNFYIKLKTPQRKNMTKRIEGTTPFFNSNEQESKENMNVLLPIFENAIRAITGPLAEITQLTHTNSEDSINLQLLQNIVKSLTTNKEGYEGSLIDGQRQDGELFWANGNRYEGQYFNNLPEGYGKLIYNTGITYVGHFHEGQYHGKGTLTTYEGEYVGEFKYGSFDGYGTFSYSNGDIFTGNYINGIRQGKGILYYNGGGSYEGEYSDNIRHGMGILTSPAGDVYQGGFKDGVFDGYGKLTFADRSPPIEGWFANNLFVSEC